MTVNHILAALLVTLAGLGRAASEPNLPAGYVFETDIPYGTSSESQRLDLLYATDTTHPLPAIVLIHSGGWYTGDKGGPRTYRMMCSFAEAGYVAVSIDYRLADEAPFPVAVEDCKLAVRWLRANAERYGIKPCQIAAMGASAGGHLAAMLAVTKPEDHLDGEKAFPETSSAVQAAVAVAAPFDLRVPFSSDSGEANDPAVTRFLGGPLSERQEVARRASPLAYACGVTVPLLIIHGTADKRVDISQAETMVRALESCGAPHEAIFIEGGEHGMGIAREKETFGRVLAFLERFLGAVGRDKMPSR